MSLWSDLRDPPRRVRDVDVDVKLDVGSVTFAKPGFDLRDAPMGDSRIELLRKFYRGEDLGDWVAIPYNSRIELSNDDVNWETAGPCVTVDRCESLERTPNGGRCVKLVGHAGLHSLWPGEAWRSD